MTNPAFNTSQLESGFSLGLWRVEPTRNTIFRKSEERHLENRLMQTLVFLAVHQGEVISREQFFDDVWKGLVVNEEALSRAISLLRSVLDDNAHSPEYIQTIPGVGYRLIANVVCSHGNVSTVNETGPAKNNSIAVLPFVNLSDDPRNEYFSDGISEEILNVLAQVDSFRVVGRTSSFAFKGKNEDLRKIGKALGVTHVLEGSVRKSGSRVRVTAQLIKVEDGYHLWSESFDREPTDIFAVQDEIADAVSVQLRMALLPATPKVTETDPEAYALFLQARSLERQSTPETYARAVEVCRQALAIAPDYAEAWHGLANIYSKYGGKGYLPPTEGHREATIALKKALELKPDYASAYATLGWIEANFASDLNKSAKHFLRALTLAPKDLEIISNSAVLARSLGRLDTAIALQSYVNERDPMNPSGHTYLGFFYRCAGQYDAAVASYRIALGLSPGILSAQYNIGASRMLQGRLDEALEETLKEKPGPFRLMGLAPVYHALDNAEKSDAAMQEMIDKHTDVAAYNIAFMLAYRGEEDRAFEWLEITLANNDAGLGQINTEPLFRNLYGDPRWESFLEGIGMASHQLARINFEVTLPG